MLNLTPTRHHPAFPSWGCGRYRVGGGVNRRPLDENGRDMFMAVVAVVCFVSIGVLLAL